MQENEKNEKNLDYAEICGYDEHCCRRAMTDKVIVRFVVQLYRVLTLIMKRTVGNTRNEVPTIKVKT